MIKITSSKPQNCINCQKVHLFRCILTVFSIPSSRENQISQTAQTCVSHIYSTNVDIHCMTFPIFFIHFPFIYCSQNTANARFTFLAPQMQNLNCFSYSTSGWASDHLGSYLNSSISRYFLWPCYKSATNTWSKQLRLSKITRGWTVL